MDKEQLRKDLAEQIRVIGNELRKDMAISFRRERKTAFEWDLVLKSANDNLRASGGC